MRLGKRQSSLPLSIREEGGVVKVERGISAAPISERPNALFMEAQSVPGVAIEVGIGGMEQAIASVPTPTPRPTVLRWFGDRSPGEGGGPLAEQTLKQEAD